MAATTTKGPRASKLIEILDKSTKQTMRACSYEKLVSCFPSLAHNDPETLKHAQEQVTAFLTTACMSEFDKILNERNALQRLNELDELIVEAKTRKSAGKPATDTSSDLPPDTLMRAYMLPLKRADLASLNESVLQLQTQNATGLSEIEKQRQQIEMRTKLLKESLSSLNTVWSQQNQSTYLLIRKQVLVSAQTEDGSTAR